MNQKKRRARSLSSISIMHYYKLVFRSILLVAATVFYVFKRPENAVELFTSLDTMPVILGIIWMLFVVEMILRFFPSKLESMGCQKQFERNYIPVEATGKSNRKGDGIALVIAFWIILNGIIGALYYAHVFDEVVLLLISLAYSVCDMICILFFCPFQTWMMKNKCCGSCRIYNWDYAMMFTPLLFVPTAYTWSLLGLALLLLITWEIAHHIHSERFYEETNKGLACANCPEKLCHHKKQLHRFWTRERKKLQERLKQGTSKENEIGTVPKIK